MTEENKSANKTTPASKTTANAKSQSSTPKKKAKPPALEDKPFTEFMEQHFLPSLKTAIEEKGFDNPQLEFKQDKIPVVGLESNPECWQVQGEIDDRQFTIYYLDGELKGQKAFSCTIGGKKPSTLESFMIDERKVTLDLMVLFALKRLNGQKWLARN